MAETENKLNMSERAELERLRTESIEREKRLAALEQKVLDDLKPNEQVELERKVAIRDFMNRGYMSGSERRKPRSEAHAAFLMRAGMMSA